MTARHLGEKFHQLYPVGVSYRGRGGSLENFNELYGLTAREAEICEMVCRRPSSHRNSRKPHDIDEYGQPTLSQHLSEDGSGESLNAPAQSPALSREGCRFRLNRAVGLSQRTRFHPSTLSLSLLPSKSCPSRARWRAVGKLGVARLVFCAKVHAAIEYTLNR